MKERGYNLHNAQSGAAITVRVIQRANNNEISEILDDGTVKIRLKSSSGEADTNQELIAFLCEVLQVKSEQLEIVAGLGGKDKLVTILDLDKSAVTDRILRRMK
jgi:uncharacterized protein YggU (UPF0235/DUF167 family)